MRWAWPAACAAGGEDGQVQDHRRRGACHRGDRYRGRTLPGLREDDGPFGEYPGTYSEVRKAPVVEITAITMRKDAIFQNAYTGMPMTENHWMMDLAATALAYREAYKICPDIDICLTSGGTSRHHCVVSIKKRHPYEPRNVMTALLAANIGIKLCVVVDEDIDVHDMQQVEWAINTRMQADRDVMILPVMYSPTLDPSAPYPRASSRWASTPPRRWRTRRRSPLCSHPDRTHRISRKCCGTLWISGGSKPQEAEYV